MHKANIYIYSTVWTHNVGDLEWCDCKNENEIWTRVNNSSPMAIQKLRQSNTDYGCVCYSYLDLEGAQVT